MGLINDMRAARDAEEQRRQEIRSEQSQRAIAEHREESARCQRYVETRLNDVDGVTCADGRRLRVERNENQFAIFLGEEKVGTGYFSHREEMRFVGSMSDRVPEGTGQYYPTETFHFRGQWLHEEYFGRELLKLIEGR